MIAVAVRDLPMVVSAIVEETPSARTFRLEPPEGSEFDFAPGQFLELAFPDAPGLRRAYSLASAPSERGSLEVTACRVPVPNLTTRLFELRGGETLLASGPSGAWFYREEFRRSVLASVGTGVAPLRSMLRHVFAKGMPHRLSMLCGFSSSAEILYRRELEGFALQGADVHVTCAAVDPAAAWDGNVGPLDGAFLRERVRDLARAACYFCGPNRLVDSLRAAAREAGVPEGRLFCEKWGDF